MVIKHTKKKLGGIFINNQKWNILQKIDIAKMEKNSQHRRQGLV